MHLLSNVLRPLAHIAKKKFKSETTDVKPDDTSAVAESNRTLEAKNMQTPSKEKSDIKLH